MWLEQFNTLVECPLYMRQPIHLTICHIRIHEHQSSGLRVLRTDVPQLLLDKVVLLVALNLYEHILASKSNNPLELCVHFASLRLYEHPFPWSGIGHGHKLQRQFYCILLKSVLSKEALHQRHIRILGLIVNRVQREHW